MDRVTGSGGSGRRGSWLRPSTRAFLAEARQTDGYSLFDLLHGYIYSRWIYLYIAIANGEHRLVRWARPLGRMIRGLSGAGSDSEGKGRGTADAYHAKVLTTGAARQLVSVREDIRLEDLEQIIPYSRARDIILKNPDHIVAVECPCRASRAEPCLPLDVCLVVGEPFAAFIAEHHPRRSRWIDSEEACAILEAEHKRGHVHHAFFNEQMLGRFFGICNCCSCCCTAMQATRQGTPMLAPSGYCSAVAADLCSGCGACVEACPFKAMEFVDGLAVVDRQKCMGCGVCVSMCPQGVPSLLRDRAKGEPLEIRELIARAKGRMEEPV